MILSLHAAAGAVLASNSNSLGQAIILGIVSHYFLDSIPHLEYKIENIKNGDLKIAVKEFTKIFIDLLIGLIIILYLIQNKSLDQSILILAGSFFALLPDGLYFLDCLVKNKDRSVFTPAPTRWVRGLTKFLKMHSNFHEKTHSKIISFKMQIIAQILVILVLAFFVFK